MPITHWSYEQFKKEKVPEDKVWDLIMKGGVNNYPMTTGTNSVAPDYLMPLHAYTVLKGL